LAERFGALYAEVSLNFGGPQVKLIFLFICSLIGSCAFAMKNIGSCAQAASEHFYSLSNIPQELTILASRVVGSDATHYRVYYRYSGNEGIPQVADIYVNPQTCQVSKDIKPEPESLREASTLAKDF
jgi:hypothetical protein